MQIKDHTRRIRTAFKAALVSSSSLSLFEKVRYIPDPKRLKSLTPINLVLYIEIYCLLPQALKDFLNSQVTRDEFLNKNSICKVSILFTS